VSWERRLSERIDALEKRVAVLEAEPLHVAGVVVGDGENEDWLRGLAARLDGEAGVADVDTSPTPRDGRGRPTRHASHPTPVQEGVE
jgi:hypothetical protein